MPTQHEIATDQMLPKVGSELTQSQIEQLPVGAIVERVRHTNEAFVRIDEPGIAPWRYYWPGTKRAGNVLYTHAEVDAQHVQLRAAQAMDPYQEARLALRDVLGMEPDEQMIRNTMEAHRPQITTMHETAKRVTNVPKPAAPNLTAGFGIAVSGGGFAASATVDTDDTVNGLARLRAHSALDALLDQHGISR